MEKKINIAELLKDCPQGMELDCTLYDNCTFEEIEDVGYIYIVINTPSGKIRLTKEGCYFRHDENAKCVIFPKGKTTWEGFQRPFKDGDIVFYNDTIAIFKEWGDETLFRTYVNTYLYCDSFIDVKVPLFGKNVRKEIRFATEEEKQKLFEAIKEKGYKWNSETKTLEKLVEPKFKVGDRIKNSDKCRSSIVAEIKDDCFIIKTLDGFKHSYLTDKLSFSKQDEWELVPNKFEINTLKTFDKVLVRDSDKDMWCASIFSHTWNDKYFCIGAWHNQCIPYEANKELLGTTNNPKEHGSN